MRTSLFSLACLFVAFSFACSDTSGPTTTCGAGTQNVDGECQTVVTCGEGTTNNNNTCVPAQGASCGAGTEEVDGLCVPSDTACQDGTHLDPDSGVCVPDFEVVCGAGTEMGADGLSCVPSDQVSCGPGTVLEESDSGDGATTLSICVPICDEGMVFNEVTSACVDQCSPGTVLNGETGTCQAACVDTEYYSVTLDACVHVPECLRNTALSGAGGDCDGWPFEELNLETVCARRAFNVCDSMFDCDCPHGGTMLGEKLIGEGGNSISIGEIGIGVDIGVIELYGPDGPDDYLLDYSSCLAEHYLYCDQWQDLSYITELVELGQVNVVDEALIDFDAHFSIDEGVCTRPVDWDIWPQDMFDDMFEGAVARGDECVDWMACSENDQCMEDDSYAPTPLEPQERFTCQALAAAGEPCGQENPMCAADLLCWYRVADGGDPAGFYCRGPIEEDEVCNVNSDCEEGLLCRPENLSLFLDPEEDEDLDEPTCQPPMGAGAHCPGEAWQAYQDRFNDDFRYNSNEPHRLDLCEADLFCKGATQWNGFQGKCEAALVEDEPCNWCDERAYDWTYQRIDYPAYRSLWLSNSTTYGWVAPPVEVPFGQCEGGLTCSYVAGTPSRGVCAGEVSVCLYSNDEIYDQDMAGLCTEICDDEIDNDNDTLQLSAAGTTDYDWIDCDDPDCEYDEACFEYVCDDGEDNDGDTDTSSGAEEGNNIDCFDFDCCYAQAAACSDPDESTDAGHEDNLIGKDLCNEAGGATDGDNCFNDFDDDGDGFEDCYDIVCVDFCPVLVRTGE